VRKRRKSEQTGTFPARGAHWEYTGPPTGALKGSTKENTMKAVGTKTVGTKTVAAAKTKATAVLSAAARLTTLLAAAALGIGASATAASAQSVNIKPTKDGLPGEAILQNVLNWAGQYALISLALGGVTGVAFWIWGVVGNNGGRQASGQKVLVVMCGAALCLGSIGMLINLFFSAGASGTV